MNRISKLFEKKDKNILSVYFTAGHPTLHSTREIIKELQDNGVDMVEIGMPFSDPLADGPVIQQSSQTALKNGMCLNLLFEQLSNIREEVEIPLLLMGYLNPVMQFGIENFCYSCMNVGIDGVILPDLPVNEYIRDYKGLFRRNGLYNIFLITPQTGSDRVKLLDNESSGFIYMVSSSSTTGARHDIAREQEMYFEKIHEMELKNPKIVGFGISNRETFQKACRYANGAIIGSAFVSSLDENNGPLQERISRFINGIK